MQDSRDKYTIDLLGRRRRGRPPSPHTPTPRERKAAQRERDRNATPDAMTVTGLIQALSRAVAAKDAVRFEALTEELRSRL